MLEVTTGCVEPAAHLFLRHIAPPVRSARLLGPHFWHNGGHALDTPPWWPSYLDSVRQIPQTHNKNTERFRYQHRPAAKLVLQPQSQPSPRPAGLARAFSLSLPNPGSGQATQSQDHVERAAQYRPYRPILTRDDRHEWQAKTDRRQNQNRDSFETQTSKQQQEQQQPQKHTDPIPLEAVDPDVQHLQNLLAPDPKANLAKLRRDKVWDVWITLPNQERFASAVLAKLADSKDFNDLDRAIQAFSIIPSEDRVSADYEHAIAAAIARHRYAQAFQFCDESAQRGLLFRPAQTLLICCLRQQLWKNAARACHIYFKGRSHHEADWPEFNADPKLIDITLRLLSRLSTPDFVLATDRPSLIELSVLLVDRLMVSTRIMSLISEQSIQQMFDHCRQLNILKPRYYIRALSTLCIEARASQRVDLAIFIFEDFKINYPSVPRGTFIGLLNLCTAASCKPETFRYIMKEYRQAHALQTGDYRAAMMAMARQANVDEVEFYFRDLCKTNFLTPDLSSLLPRVYVHAVQGDTIAAQSAFDAISNVYGMKPNTECWNTLIYAHSRSPEPQKVFSIFDRMIEQDIQPNPYTFGILAGVAGNSGDTNRTLSLIEVAGQYGIPRTGDLLASAVHSLCLNSQPDEAWQFVEQATRDGVYGSPVRMWNTLLRHYAFLTDAAAINKIQTRMRKIQVEPDEMTYAALMTALVRKSKTKEALELMRSLYSSGKTSPTPFHFSIVVHGFAMEGNRDMALSVYKEMEQRFSRVSPSARLAMLYTAKQRDLNLALQYPPEPDSRSKSPLDYTQSAAQEYLLLTSVADRVTKEPQPGFHRRNLMAALPSISAEVLIDGFMEDVQSSKTHSILQSLPSKFGENHLIHVEDIDLLGRRIFIALHQRDWVAVDLLWNAILALAFERGIGSTAPSDLVTEIRSLHGSIEKPTAAAERYNSLLQKHNLKILPAQRFLLSKPLSRYIQALEQQPNVASRIRSVIETLQASGFELSSKNWNSYVQALCRSDSMDDHLAAFKIFDERFQTNAPPYRNLISSTWLDPQRVLKKRLKSDVAPRRTTELMNPGELLPTYFTVVHLASVILKHHSTPQNLTSRLLEEVPLTYNYVCKLPYRADRVQGVLLRRAKPYSDHVQHPKKPDIVEPGGAEVRDAPLDQISDDVAAILRSRPSISDKIKPNLDAKFAEVGDSSPLPERLTGSSRQESDKELHGRHSDSLQHPLISGERFAHNDRTNWQDPDRTSPRAALLNRFLDPHPSRLKRSPKSSFTKTISRHRRDRLALSRIDAKKDALERSDVRKAARHLLRLLPRFRDLTFQARTAEKAGELDRAQKFYEWAYDPVFSWSKTMKTPASRRKVYDKLKNYVPSVGRVDDFELSLVRKIFQNPKSVMYYELTADGTITYKPLMRRPVKDEPAFKAQNGHQLQHLPQSHSGTIRSPASKPADDRSLGKNVQTLETDVAKSGSLAMRNSFGARLVGDVRIPSGVLPLDAFKKAQEDETDAEKGSIQVEVTTKLAEQQDHDDAGSLSPDKPPDAQASSGLPHRNFGVIERAKTIAELREKSAVEISTNFWGTSLAQTFELMTPPSTAPPAPAVSPAPVQLPLPASPTPPAEILHPDEQPDPLQGTSRPTTATSREDVNPMPPSALISETQSTEGVDQRRRREFLSSRQKMRDWYKYLKLTGKSTKEWRKAKKEAWRIRAEEEKMTLSAKKEDLSVEKEKKKDKIITAKEISGEATPGAKVAKRDEKKRKDNTMTSPEEEASHQIMTTKGKVKADAKAKVQEPEEAKKVDKMVIKKTSREAKDKENLNAKAATALRVMVKKDQKRPKDASKNGGS